MASWGVSLYPCCPCCRRLRHQTRHWHRMTMHRTRRYRATRNWARHRHQPARSSAGCDGWDYFRGTIKPMCEAHVRRMCKPMHACASRRKERWKGTTGRCACGHVSRQMLLLRASKICSGEQAHDARASRHKHASLASRRNDRAISHRLLARSNILRAGLGLGVGLGPLGLGRVTGQPK